MQIVSTYSVRINERGQVLRDTAERYRAAVDFYIEIILEHWGKCFEQGMGTKCILQAEILSVVTAKRPFTKYDFSASFYKFPSYLRRAAIQEAYGHVSSYQTRLALWQSNGRQGKEPGTPTAGRTFPAMYRNNMFVRNGRYCARIKVFIRNTWDWIEVGLRKCDVDYISLNCAARKECVPTLCCRGKVWSLDFSFIEEKELTKTDLEHRIVLGVDLGLNNACVCSAMHSDGTVIGRAFLKLPKEKDSLKQALGRIRKAITSKVLSELKKLQEKERDNYVRFFKEFGKILKIGLYNDFSNQDKLKELAMYESLNGDAGAMISLAEYVSAMPETQEDIYYITAESRSKALASPALEVYRSKGYDVLIMTDPIDEWVMQVLTQYDKKLLKSVAKGDLELDAESRKSLEAEAEQAGKDYAELVNYIKEELSAHVSEVRFSGRLTESPCCLVAEENGLNARMEKFLKSMNQDLPESKRILELNAKHPLIKLLAEELKDAASGEKLKDNIRLLYDQAVLNEGGEIEDLAGFSRRLSALMVAANSK